MCVFWYEKTTEKGTCRRKSPATFDNDSLPIWPITTKDDWCGEGEIRLISETELSPHYHGPRHYHGPEPIIKKSFSWKKDEKNG